MRPHGPYLNPPDKEVNRIDFIEGTEHGSLKVNHHYPDKELKEGKISADLPIGGDY